MAEPKTSYEAVPVIIRYRGLYNFGEIISFMRNWLIKDHYFFLEPKHKYKPKEQEIEFKGIRKINDYLMYNIDVWAKSEDVNDVEVIKEGKKLNMQEGKLQIKITAEMKLDWQKRFQGNKLLLLLQDVFHKYVIKRKIEDEWLMSLKIALAKFRDDIKKKFFEESE